MGLLFLWELFDKKYDYKNYIKISLTVGLLAAFIFDFFGTIVFQFWGYNSSNLFEYFAITLSTYVVATPLLVETFGFILNLSSKLKLNFNFSFSRLTSVIGIFIVTIIGYALVFLKIFELIAADLFFFAGMFIIITLWLDFLLHIYTEERGVIYRFLNGEVLAPFVIILSGFLCGFLWELLNNFIPLWSYKNLPEGNILEVPLVVVLLWGILNLSYWTGAKLFYSSLKTKVQDS